MTIINVAFIKTRENSVRYIDNVGVFESEGFEALRQLMYDYNFFPGTALNLISELAVSPANQDPNPIWIGWEETVDGWYSPNYVPPVEPEEPEE